MSEIHSQRKFKFNLATSVTFTDKRKMINSYPQ